jgi:Carboxypeptidase regulatory-like domain
MRIVKVFCVIALSIAAAANAFAQATSGALLGTVVDPGRAVVVGAAITVTHQDTGATRTGLSGSQGAFEFPDLLPGTYSVDIAAKGFKALQLHNIALSSSEKRNLGTVVLQIGAVNETVSVNADVTPVQTASAEVGQTIDSSAIRNITLKGRDPFQLIGLLPGVIDTNTNRDMEAWNSSSGIVINGLAAAAQSHLLDGMANDDDARTNTYVNPNPDAIAEIRVSSAGFQAEYGRNSGGAINFTTKSGTRNFHGTGHWDHRNEDLNANSFFNNRSGVARPVYRYMIVGYSFGGPLYVPKVSNKENRRLFFFISQEFTRTKTAATTQRVNEPTAAERTGDFSKSVGSNGVQIPVINPSTLSPFPGNIIPANLVTPLGQAMLNLLPLPNGYVNPAPGQQFTANAIFQGNGYRHRSDLIARLDANVTKKLTAFFRFGIDRDDLASVYTVSAGVGGNLNFVPTSSEAAHATYTISPTMISESGFTHGTQRYGWRHPEGSTPYYRTSTLNPPTLFPIPTQGTIYGGNEIPATLPLYEPFLPALTFGGGLTVGQTNYNPGGGGQGGFIPYNNRGYSNAATEDISKIFRSHTLKFGALWQQDHKSEPIGGGTYMGAYNFASNTSNPLDSGNGYANALLGNYQTYQQATNRYIPKSYQYTLDFYLQDSWKVSKSLTVEMGVRFNHMGAPFDHTGTSSNFNPSLYSPSSAAALYRPGCKVAVSAAGTCATANLVAVNPLNNAQTFYALVGSVVPGSGNIVNGMFTKNTGSYWSYPWMNYAPRLGFAWDVAGDGKTSVRASAGVFFNRTGIQIPGLGSAPIVFTPVVYYGQVASLSSLGSSAQVLSPTNGTFFEEHTPAERVYSFNFSVQRQIGFKTVMQMAYVGNFDRHAPEGGFTNGGTNLNSIPYQAYADPKNVFNGAEINANFLRSPYRGMGTINYASNDVSSLNYHGLSLSAQRRLSHGLFFGAAYTFSKALGTSGNDPYHTGMPILNALGQTVTLPSRRQYYYGTTGSDRTHVLSVNYSYALPSFASQKFVNAVIGNWTLSGITSASSGAAYSPGCSTTAPFPANDPTLTGMTAKCQIVADPHDFTQSFYTNFNTAAFAMAPSGTFGNTGLGIFRQPGTVNFDMALDKVIPVGERRAFRIKWQAYNVFNHTEFNAVGSTFSFNTAGVNTNTTTGQYTGALNPRQMVLTLRFEF